MNQHKMALFSSSTFAAFVLGATVLGGCVVNNDPPGPTGGAQATTSGGGGTQSGQSGQAYFVSNVFPKLSNCVGCHGNGTGPQFLAGGADGAYATIKGSTKYYKAQSIILSHGTHTGPALDAGQKAAVTEWLSLEFPGGGGGGTTPGGGGATEAPTGITMGKLVQEFQRCMDHGVWVKSNMPLFTKTQTQGFGACAGCHEQGNAGTFISDDEEEMFNATLAEPFTYRYVVANYDDDGNLIGLKASDRLIRKGQLTQGFDSKDKTYIHPPYMLNDKEFRAPTDFARDTIDKLDPKTHECEAPLR